MIKIAVTGASGRMGQALIEAIEQTDGVVLGVKLDKGDDLYDDDALPRFQYQNLHQSP
jgi:4-hydroxy-tetrahydrodipicolinate reductase